MHWIYHSLCKPPVRFHAGTSTACPARPRSQQRPTRTDRALPPARLRRARRPQPRGEEPGPPRPLVAAPAARPQPLAPFARRHFPSRAQLRCGAAGGCRLTDVISPAATGGGFEPFHRLSFLLTRHRRQARCFPSFLAGT